MFGYFQTTAVVQNGSLLPVCVASWTQPFGNRSISAVLLVGTSLYNNLPKAEINPLHCWCSWKNSWMHWWWPWSSSSINQGVVRGLYLFFFLLSQEAFVFLTVNIVGNREVELSLTPLLLESFINWGGAVGFRCGRRWADTVLCSVWWALPASTHSLHPSLGPCWPSRGAGSALPNFSAAPLILLSEAES